MQAQMHSVSEAFCPEERKVPTSALVGRLLMRRGAEVSELEGGLRSDLTSGTVAKCR